MIINLKRFKEYKVGDAKIYTDDGWSCLTRLKKDLEDHMRSEADIKRELEEEKEPHWKLRQQIWKKKHELSKKRKLSYRKH